MIKKSDWKTLDMPNETEQFAIEMQLTSAQIGFLKEGYLVKSMDSKWFAYCEENVLYLHRSWSGVCVYKVELSTDGKLQVTMNKNAAQYPNSKDFVKFLINKIVRKNLQDYKKEHDIWYEFYTTFNDNNMIHADNAFYNNHLDDLSTESLHAENIYWVREIMTHAGFSPEEICKNMPNATEYVKEVLNDNLQTQNDLENEERE